MLMLPRTCCGQDASDCDEAEPGQIFISARVLTSASTRITCVADHIPVARTLGMPRSLSPDAMAAAQTCRLQLADHRDSIGRPFAAMRALAS